MATLFDANCVTASPENQGKAARRDPDSSTGFGSPANLIVNLTLTRRRGRRRRARLAAPAPRPPEWDKPPPPPPVVQAAPAPAKKELVQPPVSFSQGCLVDCRLNWIAIVQVQQQEEVQAIVAVVLAERKRAHSTEADEMVLRTIHTILTSFGIEEEDQAEPRADFKHLRRFRKSYEQVQRIGWTAAIGVIVTRLLTALWVGVKVVLGK